MKNIMTNIMKTMGIYTLAFTLAVAIPSLVVGIYFGIDRADWSEVLPYFFFGAIYASVHVIILALPTFLVFQDLGLVNLRTSVMSGFVIGCIPTSFIVTKLAATLQVGACGALGGLVFWLVIRCTKDKVLTEPPPAESVL